MLKLLRAMALLRAAHAQYSGGASLPTVDLGYEVYQASNFNDTGNFYNFSNIRYAAPPVGELRFAPPQPPAENRSTVNDGGTSRICPQGIPAWSPMQIKFLTSTALGTEYTANQTYVVPGANSSSPVPNADPRESEDCLFLDVFVPEKVMSKVGQGYAPLTPVLVWIYGGGYTLGNKNTDPSGLFAASGNSTDGEIIYVSFNYRLGALGWQSGPSYQAEGGVANLGLHDQRFALEWIQNNIHKFGGDKNRVTVFGDSAGGGSIMHQITAYGGKNNKAPFQQAIPQSPGWQPVQSNALLEGVYRDFMDLTNASSLAELRALSSEEVIRANKQQIAYNPWWGNFVYGPSVDGDFVPLQPGQLLAQGRFDKDVRVMVGHNSNEGISFTDPSIRSDEALVAQLKRGFPAIPDSSIEYLTQTLYPPVFDGSYPYTSQLDRAILITSESIFTCNTNYLSTAYGNRTYSYLFAPPPAFHGYDTAYVFFTGGGSSNPLNVVNQTIAVALQEFITAFAKSGVPEADGVMQFNMYGPDANVLKLNITGFEQIRDSNANERCSWWQKAILS